MIILFFLRGADDLLPVLSYVIVQSGSPGLYAECQALTEFIDEGSEIVFIYLFIFFCIRKEITKSIIG